jgi:hypothetical protein
MVLVRLRRSRIAPQTRDKTASLPQLDITDAYSLLCLLDGFLIVSAFDIFGARKVTVATNGVDAICGHAAPLSQNEDNHVFKIRTIVMR